MNTNTRPAAFGSRGRPAFRPPMSAPAEDKASMYERLSVVYFELATKERQIARLKRDNARLRRGTTGRRAGGNDRGARPVAGAPAGRSVEERQERELEQRRARRKRCRQRKAGVGAANAADDKGAQVERVGAAEAAGDSTADEHMESVTSNEETERAAVPPAESDREDGNDGGVEAAPSVPPVGEQVDMEMETGPVASKWEDWEDTRGKLSVSKRLWLIRKRIEEAECADEEEKLFRLECFDARHGRLMQVRDRPPGSVRSSEMARIWLDEASGGCGDRQIGSEMQGSNGFG
jgi:hypothetical protein